MDGFPKTSSSILDIVGLHRCGIKTVAETAHHNGDIVVFLRQLLVAVLACRHILWPLQQWLVGEDQQYDYRTDKESPTPFFVFDKVGKDEKQYHPSKRQKEDFEYFGNNEKQDVKVIG